MKAFYNFHKTGSTLHAVALLAKYLVPVATILLGSMLLLSCSQGEGNSYYDNIKKSLLGSDTKMTAEIIDTDGKGVGPVTTVILPDTIDEQLVLSGKAAFEWKCAACHSLSADRAAGPGLAGITKRRKPEWVMNMMLNPEQMTQRDPVAKQLLSTHLVQMTNQQLNEKDARALLEYFRKNDAGM